MLAAAAGGFAWRWWTTPVPPELPLERMEPAVADAVRAAAGGVAAAPRSGAAWGKLALVAQANGYPDQAAQCLIEAEQLDPANPRWPYLRAQQLLLGNPRQAFPLLRRALALAESDPQRAAIGFRLALALIEEGQLDEAETQLAALRPLDADGARVHLGLALLALARDDRPLAHTHLEPLLASPFARRQAHAHLAALALAEGDAALADTYQRSLAQLPPDLEWPDPIVAEMSTHAAGRQNRFLEAERLEGRGQLREAVALLRTIAARTPDARSGLALGLGLGKLGEYDEAVPVLRGVLDMDPHNLQAQHFLGTVLLLKGEQADAAAAGALFEQAVAAEDAALAIQPDHAMAHLMRGRALAHLGCTNEAIRALRAAVACGPQYTDTHLYLGETLARAGQVAEGLTHLEEAARLAAPGDARPREALAKWRGAASR